FVVCRKIQQRRQVGRGIGGGAGIPVWGLAVVWAAPGWQKQASGIGYARQNDDQPKGARGGEAKVELANLVRILARRRHGSQLSPVFCKVSHNEKCAMGELADVRRGRGTVGRGCAKRFREPRGVPRKDCWPDSCGAEFGGGGSFRACDVV